MGIGRSWTYMGLTPFTIDMQGLELHYRNIWASTMFAYLDISAVCISTKADICLHYQFIQHQLYPYIIHAPKKRQLYYLSKQEASASCRDVLAANVLILLMGAAMFTRLHMMTSNLQMHTFYTWLLNSNWSHFLSFLFSRFWLWCEYILSLELYTGFHLHFSRALFSYSDLF